MDIDVAAIRTVAREPLPSLTGYGIDLLLRMRLIEIPLALDGERAAVGVSPTLADEFAPVAIRTTHVPVSPGSVLLIDHLDDGTIKIRHHGRGGLPAAVEPPVKGARRGPLLDVDDDATDPGA